MNDSITVEILSLQLDPSSGISIVVLGPADNPERVMPIFIGPAEAQSIALAMQGIEPPRPATHDLFVAALRAAGTRISDVAITTLRDGTFIGEIGLVTEHGEERIDSRPSDGLALAVRVGAPVNVARRVFDTASVVVVQDPKEQFSEEEIERITSEFRRFIETAAPEDFDDDQDAGGAPEGPA